MISGVCRCVAADAVRAGVAHHLAAEQVRLGGLAGAAGAGGGDHDDVGLDQAGGDGGREGRASRRSGSSRVRRSGVAPASSSRWPGSSGRP